MPVTEWRFFLNAGYGCDVPGAGPCAVVNIFDAVSFAILEVAVIAVAMRVLPSSSAAVAWRLR